MFATPVGECRARNRARGKPVPDAVLSPQVRRVGEQRPGLEAEGFDTVLDPVVVRIAPPAVARAAPLTAQQSEAPVGLALRAAESRCGRGPAARPSCGPASPPIAAAAEEAGFGSIWVMDHFRQIPMFGGAWQDMLESWTTLAFLAGVTERVRLGTLVTGITYRNVAHLGKIAATLDVLSGGRALCGVGLGWFAEEHRAYGWSFPSTAERYALLEDALQVLPLVWGKGSPAFEGRAIEVPEAMGYPRPLQERIPILVGGNGERRTLRLAARYADACNVIGEVDVVRRKVAALHDALRVAGPRSRRGRGDPAVHHARGP